MHPRNPYKHHPDFGTLAEFFPSLKQYLSLSPAGQHTLDFRDPNAQRALTQALLKRDFNITLSLPENRLCPPVISAFSPQACLIFISALTGSQQDILFPYDEVVADKEIKGLDIGTGASAIYPLLACSLPNTEKWTFVGTEIDLLSADFASRNVEVNNFQSRITVYPITPATEEDSKPIPILAPLVTDSESRFDFTMCNPPFYGSTSEIENSAEAKDLPPTSVCTGSETEMITPGGETAFVLQMLHESAREDVRGRCRWYTSMLGKLGSVGEVVKELRRLNVDNYALTQFVQGTTRRWAVAWSFEEHRLPDAVARPSSSSLSSYLPAPTALRQTFKVLHQRNDRSPSAVVVRLKTALSDVLDAIEGVVFHPIYKDPQDPAHDALWKFDITADENTWSRAARRKRKRSVSPSGGRRVEKKQKQPQQQKQKTPRLDDGSLPQTPIPLPRDANAFAPDFFPRRPAAMRCRISVANPLSGCSSHAGNHQPRLAMLEAQWTRGEDRGMFEGFWSHVCRKVIGKLEEDPVPGEGSASIV